MQERVDKRARGRIYVTLIAGSVLTQISHPVTQKTLAEVCSNVANSNSAISPNPISSINDTWHLRLAAGKFGARCHPVRRSSEREREAGRVSWSLLDCCWSHVYIRSMCFCALRWKMRDGPFDFAIASVAASHVARIIARVPFRETRARPKRAASPRKPSSRSPFWFTLTVVSSRAAECPARGGECACARQVAARVSLISPPQVTANSCVYFTDDKTLYNLIHEWNMYINI